MRKKGLNKVYSVLLLGALSAGNIMFVQSGVWNLTAGTPLEVSAGAAASYGINSVSVQKDGSYIVNSSVIGYNENEAIQIAVIFDADGQVIQQVQVLSQAETEGIGSKVTEEAFLGQLAGIAAPVGLNGHAVAVVSPGTGEVWGGTSSAEAVAVSVTNADNRTNPERWNPDDQSPEAQAVRELYRAGLLTSAINKEPLKTAIADEAPELQAAYQLEQSGLSTSTEGNYRPSRDASPEAVAAAALQTAALTVSADGKTAAARDVSPEAVAAGKLEAAGLTVAAADGAVPDEPAETPAAGSGALNEVDAVSGATVSSTAVIQAIDQAYFYMQEQVLNGGSQKGM